MDTTVFRRESVLGAALSSAAMIEIDLSARGRARADAQGRCDGAGSEEIGCRNPPAQQPVLEGFGFTLNRSQWLHFFGEVSERWPWAKTREDRPAAFAGRSEFVLFPGSSGYHAFAYTGEYPIPPKAAVTPLSQL
jgi:hypothetical protein